jgi:hypothetical protein
MMSQQASKDSGWAVPLTRLLAIYGLYAQPFTVD